MPLRAAEGLCEGLREPEDVAPDCELTEVIGLKVTVRAGRRPGRGGESVDVLCCGRSGEDSLMAVAIAQLMQRCFLREEVWSEDVES